MGQLIVPLPYMLQFPQVLQRRDHSRRDEPIRTGVPQHAGRAVVVPQRLRPLRRLPGGDHPARGPGDRQRRRHERCRRSPPLPAWTEPSSSTTSRCARPTGNNSSSRSIFVSRSATRWSSPASRAAGKTTLLRSLAELWPFTTGTLTRPCGPNETMFLSQLPYVPLGDLRAVVTYPNQEGSIDDETLTAHAREGGAAAPGAEARRGAGLGQGPLTG